MAEVKLKEELELWEPAEVDNSVVDQIKEEADDRGVQRGNESCSSLVQMKEEPVEFSIKQEPLQEFPFICVIVKSEDEEDKSSVLHLKIIEETEENREETNGADPGLDKHSESARDTQTDDTDDSEQWTGPTEASAEQLEIDLHKQDCNLPHVKGLQGAVNDAGDKIKQHKCPACAKRFQSKVNLNLHMLLHTGRTPFKCSVCEKDFIQASHLKTHMRTHTGERPFSCSFCEKAFAAKHTLTCHVRIHTGEKPYSCSICNKRFTRNYVKRHMRQHTGEKLFRCLECGKRFIHLQVLRTHLLNHRNKRPFMYTV